MTRNDCDTQTILTRLYTTINARKGANPDSSYSASLLAKGPAHCARKFGEEAVEAIIAGTSEDKQALIKESADVLYHLMVLLAARDVTLDDVASELAKREGISGHAEKAGRLDSTPPKPSP